jgi:hypothetical protein
VPPTGFPQAEASPTVFANELDSRSLKSGSDRLNSLLGDLTPFFFKIDHG